ncbi:MAG: RNA polymerase-binding protein RbpA [Actinomycetaceae bacterium]|nr:RNA polymerase-binding protein RbpA [Actinomycetaceae bacterium]
MAERSLRGMKIGANSLETDTGVKFVPREPVYYVCPQGHEFPIAMVLEVVAPPTWECRCGQEAKLRDRDESEDEEIIKPVRTHWDMLMERRNEEELQVLLDERLELLREGKLRLRFRHR